MEKVTALVPIKEHSERIPRKNFQPIGQRPLFRVIIDTLLECEHVAEVIVNTDSKEIIENLKPLSRVRVIWRPEHLVGDFVSMNKIIGYDLGFSSTEHILQTHCTNPLLKKETIDGAIVSFLAHQNEYDSLFSVTKFQNRFYFKDASPLNHNPSELLRTQDLEPIFEENSCLYLFSKTSFMKKETRIGSKPMLFPIPKREAVDIDEYEDYYLAKAIYQGSM